ncbi:Fe-S-containing protein [Faecalispora jeddahensis]|uniref:Fe-S-containing protein n=1 Tax=Faecalispora jeddahensis TaxID=1414721 RepID=UPI0027B908A9|nr:Fe-S-containing protein [Faecalispora jeddahensis]
MLKYLIQVVQNSLTTGILLAMLFALSQLGGKQKQKKWLLWGLTAGVAAAFLLAVLKSTTVLINREYFNIGILSVAILSEILFCMLLWGVLQKKLPELHERIWSVLYAVLAASLLLYALPDIFLYPTEFLLAGQSVFSTDFLYKSIGYLGGLLIVGLSGLALYQAGTGLSFRLVRILLTVGLAVNMVKQIATIAQFLLARRMIPMSKGLFEFIKMSVNYNDWFLYGIMVITILMPVLLWIKSLHPTDAFSNPAQHRRIRAVSRRQRRWCTVVLAGYLLSILCLTVVRAYDEREAVLSPAEPMDIVGSEIVIPLENVGDGHLHRFIYTASNGTEVRFIVIRKSANTNSYGVGLDACDICGPTGYYERGDHEVVCKLCDVVMNISTIGFKGGCNPVPLSYTIRAGNMVIQTNDLESEKKRFE